MLINAIMWTIILIIAIINTSLEKITIFKDDIDSFLPITFIVNIVSLFITILLASKNENVIGYITFILILNIIWLIAQLLITNYSKLENILTKKQL